MTRVIYLICIMTLSTSCKKDPPENPEFLTGEKAIFARSWEWMYSDHFYGNCLNMSFFEVIDPASSGNTHTLIFSPAGTLRHLKNNSIERDYTIHFDGISPIETCSSLGPNPVSFGIHLNNNKDNDLFGCLAGDTMRIGSGFLYDDFEEGCEFYQSYFVKK